MAVSDQPAVSWGPVRAAWQSSLTAGLGAEPGEVVSEGVDHFGAHEEGMELGIEYTSDELMVLAELMEQPAFPGVEAGPYAELSDEVREAIFETAGRCLVARRVLVPAEREGEAVVDLGQPHAGLLALACTSQLLIRAQRAGGGETESRSYYVEPDAAAVHHSPMPAIHRLVFTEPRDVVAHALNFLELTDRPQGSERFVVERERLGRAEQAAAEGSGETVDGLPDGAAAYLGAVAARVSSCYLSALRTEGETLVGGELVWLDGGDEHGLWAVEPVAIEPPPEGSEAVDADPGPEMVEVARVSSAWIVEQLLSFLPDELTPVPETAAPAGGDGDDGIADGA